MDKERVLKITNSICKDTLMETLEIEFTDVGEDFLTAQMPVNKKVYQPDGVLHGGATAALAESVGSFAAHIFSDKKDFIIRGIEITANHIRSVKNGFIYAKAKFIHKGRTTQILSIDVTDESNNLISYCKLTTISLPKKK